MPRSRRLRPWRHCGTGRSTSSSRRGQAEDDLDAEIAWLTEKIRQVLWITAAFWWHRHHNEAFTAEEVSADGNESIAAMIYAWQQAIDAGQAEPVTEVPNGGDFRAPDAPWPGLGLRDDGHEAWGAVWHWCSIVLDEMRRLQRRCGEREVHTLVMEGVDIDDLFTEDGDYIKVPKPTFFTDDLITKVDRRGAPDYARAAGGTRTTTTTDHRDG